MKKTALYLRIALAVTVFFMLTFFKYNAMISLEAFIFSVTCVFISVFFNPALFLATNIPLLFLGIIDWHLKRIYQISVIDAAPWISLLILDTNKTEIQEYLFKINIIEYVLLAFIPIFMIFIWSYRPARKIPKSLYLAFWLAFPLSYISHLYPTVRFFSALRKRLR